MTLAEIIAGAAADGVTITEHPSGMVSIEAPSTLAGRADRLARWRDAYWDAVQSAAKSMSSYEAAEEYGWVSPH